MVYRRIGAAVVLLLALTRPLSAQVLQSGTITAQDAGSCATATGCLTFQVPTGVTSLLFQVSGTYSGTLTFEATADPSSASTQTWFALGVVKGSDGTYSTTTTSTGQFSAPGAGYLQVRVRAGSFASGTATISFNRGYFVSRLMFPVFDTVTASHFVGGDFTGTTYGGTTFTASTKYLAPTGCTTVPYSFTGRTGDGFCNVGSSGNRLGFYLTGVDKFYLNNAGGEIALASDLGLTWSTTTNAEASTDVRIRRSATKTLTVDDGAGGAATLAVTGGLTTTGNVASGNRLTAAADLSVGTDVGLGASGVVSFAGRARMSSPGDGLANLFNSGGTFAVQVNSGTAAPTLTACGTGTIVNTSRNSAGTVTATGATACTVTFATPNFTNTPHCVVTEDNALTTTPYISARSTSAITVSGLTAGDVFTYLCFGGA